MIRRSVDYRQDLTNQIRLCKFLVGDTPSMLTYQAIPVNQSPQYFSLQVQQAATTSVVPERIQ